MPIVQGRLKRNGRSFRPKKAHYSAADVEEYARQIEAYLRQCGFDPDPGVVGKYATMDQMQRIEEEEQREREIERKNRMASAVSGTGLLSRGVKPKQSSRRKRKTTGSKSISAGYDELNK